jgi:hypothetical protein
LVEVKGTTTSGEMIILTKNEVELASRDSKNVALYVLSDIVVSRSNNQFVLSGGTERPYMPWQIVSSRLTPLAFKYVL